MNMENFKRAKWGRGEERERREETTLTQKC
jgi:hypothetical protein